MNFDVEIEKRNCLNCKRPFKVMTTSKSRHCSAQCLSEFGTQALGEPQKASKKSAPPTETISVKIGTPRTAPNPAAAFDARVGVWPKRNATPKEPASITSETRKSKMKDEKQEPEKTVSASAKTPDEITTPTRPSDSPKFTRAAIVETQPESSGGQLININVASSGILNLSRRSAERLLTLMETLVTDEDLEKQKEGVCRVDTYKIETAIKCATGIAQIVQTNINLLKAMKGMEK